MKNTQNCLKIFEIFSKKVKHFRHRKQQVGQQNKFLLDLWLTKEQGIFRGIKRNSFLQNYVDKFQT